MTAVSETVEITNQRGLHARASAKFVEAVSRVPSGNSVRVAKDGHDAAGNSILGLMMLGAAKGDTIEIAVTGSNADIVLGDLVDLVAGGFGEE